MPCTLHCWCVAAMHVSLHDLMMQANICCKRSHLRATVAMHATCVGRSESKEKKSPKLRFNAANILRAKRWGLGA